LTRFGAVKKIYEALTRRTLFGFDDGDTVYLGVTIYEAERSPSSVAFQNAHTLTLG
jgi:hypothetical protein